MQISDLKIIDDSIIPIYDMENAQQRPEWCMAYRQVKGMTLGDIIRFAVDKFTEFAGYVPECGHHYKGNLYLEWRPEDGNYNRGWQESESEEE